MNYSIPTIMSNLLCPRHELSCSWFVWRRLVRALRERGHGATRESGAFLLGHRTAGRARITNFVLYDDLDPHCLDTGIVHFDGRYYGALWSLVERKKCSVIADVHVHPGQAFQSDPDRRNPMIAQAGHIALILPNFAAPPASHETARIYVFEQRGRWRIVPPHDTRTVFYVGLP